MSFIDPLQTVISLWYKSREIFCDMLFMLCSHPWGKWHLLHHEQIHRPTFFVTVQYAIKTFKDVCAW